MTAPVNLTGSTFNKLTALKRVGTDKKGSAVWKFKCCCGNYKNARGWEVKSGKIKTCGCRATKDLTGNKYGRWTVIKKCGYRNRNILYLCECVCGIRKKIRSGNLTYGSSRSCGKCRYTRLKPTEAGLNNLYSSYRWAAYSRGYSFKISKETFKSLTSSRCFYCLRKPTLVQSGQGNISKERKKYGSYQYNGIDRINNKKGYFIGNVRPCCKLCNISKHILTENEFARLVMKQSKWAKRFLRRKK